MRRQYPLDSDGAALKGGHVEINWNTKNKNLTKMFKIFNNYLENFFIISGDKWMEAFMERNSDVIRFRVPSKKSAGMKFVTKKKLQEWLCDYKEWINENIGSDIWDDSSRFINMDETSIVMDGQDGRVMRIIAECGDRHVFRESAGKF